MTYYTDNFIFFRFLSDSILPTSMSLRSNPNTLSLSEQLIFEADHIALTEHLEKNPVQQRELDRYLLYGFLLVQRRVRDMSYVAPRLNILLRYGAKWEKGALLKDLKTPCHLICQSTGDHDQLLESIITLLGRVVINARSRDGSTALLYAVKNANISCVRRLIAHGANVNLANDSNASSSSSTFVPTVNPITATIQRLQPDSKYPFNVMTDIFDLLLESGVDVNNSCGKFKLSPFAYAIYHRNVPCIKKLVQKGGQLYTTDHRDGYVWTAIANMGNVELLKCMFDYGLDKNCTDMKGRSILSYVVNSGNVEAIQYLLDLGATVTTYTPKTKEIACEHCGKKRTLIDSETDDRIMDPCIVACVKNMPHVIQLLENYGSLNFKFINTLRHAVILNNVDVVRYLLRKYTYPLNVEYATDYCTYRNLLKEACCNRTDEVAHLLLDHGADPNVVICERNCSSVINTAIAHGHVRVVARFIRNGVDINRRSYDRPFINVLPFEASVLYGNFYVADMLLVSGCSCGVYSLNYKHKFKANVKPELKRRMKNWEVQRNRVTALQNQCRRAILSHLSPKAEKKSLQLPLPPILIRYLSIPELDDIMNNPKDQNGIDKL